MRGGLLFLSAASAFFLKVSITLCLQMLSPCDDFVSTHTGVSAIPRDVEVRLFLLSADTRSQLPNRKYSQFT